MDLLRLITTEVGRVKSRVRARWVSLPHLLVLPYHSAPNRLPRMCKLGQHIGRRVSPKLLKQTRYLKVLQTVICNTPCRTRTRTARGYTTAMPLCIQSGTHGHTNLAASVTGNSRTATRLPAARTPPSRVNLRAQHSFTRVLCSMCCRGRLALLCLQANVPLLQLAALAAFVSSL